MGKNGEEKRGGKIRRMEEKGKRIIRIEWEVDERVERRQGKRKGKKKKRRGRRGKVKVNGRGNSINSYSSSIKLNIIINEFKCF